MIEALYLAPPNTALYGSPLADLNLRPFLVTNHNHEYKSFQWVLWVLQANYNLGVVLDKLWSWCQKWGQSWGLLLLILQLAENSLLLVSLRSEVLTQDRLTLSEPHRHFTTRANFIPGSATCYGRTCCEVWRLWPQLYSLVNSGQTFTKPTKH